MRPTPTVTALLAGVVLLALVPLGLALERATEFGPAPSAASPSGPDEAEATSGTTPETTDDPVVGAAATRGQRAGEAPRPPARSAPAVDVTVRSARVEDLPSAPAAPVEVRLERLAITAPVDPVGATDGVMDLPDDVRRAGWFAPGSAPGADHGRAVISSHVDNRAQGEGSFFPLADAQEGDRIEVDLADGQTLRYEVTALARYRKTELPAAELFRPDGEPQLVLITCGGPFDPATRSYRDNVVVIADVASE